MLVRLRELPRNEKQIAMPAHLINAAMNGQVCNRAAPPTLPAITSNCAIPHSLVRFFRYPAGFRNFIPKHAFARYCWLTTDSLVNVTNSLPAGAVRAFTLRVGLFATPWLHPKGG